MKHEALFELIVNTLLSNVQVEPSIIREHIAKYARECHLSYYLAKQAVILTAKHRLQKKLEQI
jgi:hypothetical protein